MVTGPYPAVSSAMIEPAGEVWAIAAVKLLQGAESLHGLVSSPEEETNVRGALNADGTTVKAMINASARLISVPSSVRDERSRKGAVRPVVFQRIGLDGVSSVANTRKNRAAGRLKAGDRCSVCTARPEVVVEDCG